MPGQHTAKQKRQAEHIIDSAEKQGHSEDEAKRIAWATVNAQKGMTKSKTPEPSIPDAVHAASGLEEKRTAAFRSIKGTDPAYHHHQAEIHARWEHRHDDDGNQAQYLAHAAMRHAHIQHAERAQAAVNEHTARVLTNKKPFRKGNEMSLDALIKAAYHGTLGTTSSGKRIPKPTQAPRDVKDKFSGVVTRHERATSGYSHNDHLEAAAAHQKAADKYSKAAAGYHQDAARYTGSGSLARQYGAADDHAHFKNRAEHFETASRAHEQLVRHHLKQYKRAHGEHYGTQEAGRKAGIRASVAQHSYEAKKEAAVAATKRKTEARTAVANKSEESVPMGNAYEDLFKSELGSDGDKVLIECPHCEQPITKAQVLAKAGQSSGAKGSDVHQNTQPTVGGPLGKDKKNTRVGVAGITPGAEANPGAHGVHKAESSKAEDLQKAELKGPRIVAGTRYVQYVDTGEDARIADLIAKGMLGDGAIPNVPIDRNQSPTRNMGG